MAFGKKILGRHKNLALLLSTVKNGGYNVKS